MVARHSAPGQYLGFALQPVRLCYHLLTCPKGAQVSLEYLDDVGIHGADGRVVLEQCKSALSQNPLSDWSIDLWKTVANWLELIATGQVAAEQAEFQLYVTPVWIGHRAQLLNDANSQADVEALTAAVQAALKKRRSKPECMPYLQRLLDATDDERLAVITRMKVISVDADPIDQLRTCLELTIAPELLDSVIHAAIGMAKEQADRLIRRGELAMLDAVRFRAEFRAFVQRNNLPGLLTSYSAPPESAEVSALLANRPTFIRQLELIEVRDDERFRAVSDYLRTSADKSIWAEKGLIFEQGLRDWDDGLVRRHGAIAGEVSDLHMDRAPEVRGRLTYRKCAQLEAPLDGRAVPMHFIHGSFNELADCCRLGWHPDYAILLETEDA